MHDELLELTEPKVGVLRRIVTNKTRAVHAHKLNTVSSRRMALWIRW